MHVTLIGDSPTEEDASSHDLQNMTAPTSMNSMSTNAEENGSKINQDVRDEKKEEQETKVDSPTEEDAVSHDLENLTAPTSMNSMSTNAEENGSKIKQDVREEKKEEQETKVNSPTEDAVSHDIENLTAPTFSNSMSTNAEGKGSKIKQDVRDGKKEYEETKVVPIYKLFSLADSTDFLLMILGAVGALANGATMPLFTVIMKNLLNTFGEDPDIDHMVHRVSKVNDAFFQTKFVLFRFKLRLNRGKSHLRRIRGRKMMTNHERVAEQRGAQAPRLRSWIGVGLLHMKLKQQRRRRKAGP